MMLEQWITLIIVVVGWGAMALVIYPLVVDVRELIAELRKQR
jgi:hypothetical protein